MRLPRIPALAAICVALAGPVVAQANLLIIVADDLGVDMLECYGEGQDLPHTPAIDSLALQGVRFRNCWSTPLCTPTRATLMTGRNAHRTGLGHIIEGGGLELQLSELTLPEVLAQQSGGAWSMAAIGKWHLGATLDPDHPNASGWPHFVGNLGNLPLPGQYYSWEKVRNGATTTTTTYATTDTVDEAVAWIGGAPEPWICYLAFNAPHGPFHEPPAHLIHGELPDVDPRELPRPFYKAAIEAMDTEMGRLLDYVSWATGPTNVIFLGDNGTPRDVVAPPTVPARAKLSVYEGGVNVPLIVSGPAVNGGGRWSEALVQTTDLFMTSLDLAGVTPSPSEVPEDSVSFAPYLASASAPAARSFVYTERFRPNGFGPFVVRRRAVRGERYKLIRTNKSRARDELYDLLTDRYEEVNLLDRDNGPPTPQVLAALYRLRAKMESVSGP